MSYSRVTARDVARHARVSPGTVSKAFSGKGAVHPDTHARILDAARELGYRGHPTVDAPATDLTPLRTVGLISRSPFDRRTTPVLLGILERLTEHNMAFLACDGRGDPIREQYFIDSLSRRRVDGYIVSGSNAGSLSRISLGDRLNAPVVYAMTESTDERDVSVIPDNWGGMTSAVKHLLHTGRRRIVCILGPAHEEAAKQKIKACLDVLQANGLSFAAEPLHGTWEEEWGRQAVPQLIRSRAQFDGLICANDAIARGVTAGLHEMGIRVPDEVGVVGFDNWGAMVEANRPRLTSVDLRLAEVGRTAAQLLINAIEERPAESGTVVIPSRLVTRESTALDPSHLREEHTVRHTN